MNERKPLVSVIIVNYNAGEFLNRTFSDLAKQDYQEMEIIVVDNHSTDDSLRTINSFCNEYLNCRLIELLENQGFAIACNKAVDIAVGDSFLFLNPDTSFSSTLISGLVNEILSSNLSAVAPVEYDFNDQKILPECGQIDFTGYPVLNASLSADFYLKGACFLIKRKDYLQLGGFDNNFFMYYEETDLFWRMQLAGLSFKVAHDLKFYHEVGYSTRSTELNYHRFLWRNQNCLQMILKNYSTANLLWILPVYLIINWIEIVCFSLIGKFKIARSYLEGWFFNISNISQILSKREKAQCLRKVNDRHILNRMYIGFAKVHRLSQYLRSKNIQIWLF